MSNVLIIGAGGVGQVVTHKCAQRRDIFSEITLASRTKSKCDAIAAQLDNSIKTAQVDADNVPELVALIKQVQPKLVINVALPYQDLTSWMPAWRPVSTTWTPPTTSRWIPPILNTPGSGPIRSASSRPASWPCSVPASIRA